ncbi:hypothetical protein U1Q18_005749 [Sarracenia purpurea var. burkii]
MSNTTNSDRREEDRKAVSNYVREFGTESKKLWKIAGPMIVTAVCQYSLGALTQIFTGRIGEIELAVVAVENSVIAGLAYGVMCTGDPMWSSIRRRTTDDVRGIYAEIMDHLADHCMYFGSLICLLSSHSQVLWRDYRDF